MEAFPFLSASGTDGMVFSKWLNYGESYSA